MKTNAHVTPEHREEAFQILKTGQSPRLVLRSAEPTIDPQCHPCFLVTLYAPAPRLYYQGTGNTIQRAAAQAVANFEHSIGWDVVAELADLQALFSMRYDADQRALARWRAAFPGNELVIPDQADLCTWHSLNAWTCATLTVPPLSSMTFRLPLTLPPVHDHPPPLPALPSNLAPLRRELQNLHRAQHGTAPPHPLAGARVHPLHRRQCAPLPPGN